MGAPGEARDSSRRARERRPPRGASFDLAHGDGPSAVRSGAAADRAGCGGVPAPIARAAGAARALPVRARDAFAPVGRQLGAARRSSRPRAAARRAGALRASSARPSWLAVSARWKASRAARRATRIEVSVPARAGGVADRARAIRLARHSARPGNCVPRRFGEAARVRDPPRPARRRVVPARAHWRRRI